LLIPHFPLALSLSRPLPLLKRRLFFFVLRAANQKQITIKSLMLGCQLARARKISILCFLFSSALSLYFSIRFDGHQVVNLLALHNIQQQLLLKKGKLGGKQAASREKSEREKEKLAKKL
jgi:hypothetical protein